MPTCQRDATSLRHHPKGCAAEPRACPGNPDAFDEVELISAQFAASSNGADESVRVPLLNVVAWAVRQSSWRVVFLLSNTRRSPAHPSHTTWGARVRSRAMTTDDAEQSTLQ